jgi:hypothetical protein
MERRTQPAATHGNGFGLFSRLPLRSDLPQIATGCNHAFDTEFYTRADKNAFSTAFWR